MSTAVEGPVSSAPAGASSGSAFRVTEGDTVVASVNQNVVRPLLPPRPIIHRKNVRGLSLSTLGSIPPGGVPLPGCLASSL